jgi:hypothetical protein
MRRLVPLVLVAPLVGLGMTAHPAAASPLWDPTAGRAVFTGPTSPHGTSPLINPAALQLAAEGVHVYGGGSITFDQYGIDRRFVDPETAAQSPGPSVSATTFAHGESLAFYYVTRNFSVAALLDLPPEEKFIADEEALAYHTLGGRHGQHIYAGSVSYRVTSRIVLGVGLRLVTTQLELAFDRDTALDGGRGDTGIGADCGGSPCGVENPAAAERYTLDLDTGSTFSRANSGLNAGMLIGLADDWWLAIAYDSPYGLALGLEGDVTVRSPTRLGGATHHGEATVHLYLPQTVTAGLRGRVLPRWDLVIGGRYSNLSRFDQYDLRTFGGDLAAAGVPEWLPRPRGFHDVYAGNAGLEQVDIGGRFVVGGRIGVESASVTARRTSPMQPYGLALTADVGGQVRILPQLVLQLGYGLAWSPEVDSGDSAYDPIDRLDCVESGYDYSTGVCAAVRAGYAGPTGAGTYRHLGHAARLGVRFDY